MCFLQHGGAPVLFSTEVMEFFSRITKEVLYGEDGVVVWPNWSPDLNSIDFFCVAYG